MPIKLKANNGNIDLKVPIQQIGGGAVDSVNGMTGDVVLEIPSKTSDLVNDSGFLTQIPSEYVTETELDAKGYLTEHQSLADYAKKSEIPDVSGFLTSIPDEYVTETELDAKGYLTEHQSLENYATKDYVSNALTPYAKKSELFSKDYNDLTNKPTIPSVEGLASTQYVDNKVSEIVVPSLEGYATEQWVENKGYLTQHQSLDEYAKKSELFSKDYNDLTNKPTIPSVDGLASTNYVDEKVAAIVVPSLDGYATEQWVEGKGYLTQHQSLADYATKSELATKQDTLTAGSNITIENGVISATGGSGGGSYTLPVADYDTLGGVKAKQTDTNKQYGMVYIDNDARLRVPIAHQGVSSNAGIVLPAAGQFRVEDDGSMLLLPADSYVIGGVKPDGTTTTVDTDGTIHAVMPEPYTLPTASTTTLGGVKVDGNTITITADGTITSAAGGLIGKKMESYNQPESQWTWIADWAQHPEKYYVVIEDSSGTGKDCPVIYTWVANRYFYYYWFEDNTLHARYITFTDSTLSQVESVSKYADSGTVWLTEQNWNQYITGGGGSDWSVTTSTSESNLYNAKEVVIFWKDSNYNRHQSYLNVGCDYYGNSGASWGNSNWMNTEIKLDSIDSSYNGSSITYDGSNINTFNCTIEAICYKT